MIRNVFRKILVWRATRDHSSLGNVLVRLGYVTHEQIGDALARQRRERIGDLLVASGYVTVEQLREALLHQRVARDEAGLNDLVQLYGNERREVLRGVIHGLREVTDLSGQVNEHIAKHA
jgi:hypothetical protein